MTEFRERPILFSAPMVRALAAKTKTQTRRALRPQPQSVVGYTVAPFAGTATELQSLLDKCGRRSPYGQAGDRLWVKETWRVAAELDHLKPSLLPVNSGVAYAAGGSNFSGNTPLVDAGKTRVSIFMPRWASRTTLEIVRVSVERLNDCSEADCIAEGATGGHDAIRGYNYNATPHEHYKHIWESINGAGSWAANPWVWRVEFQVLP